MVGRGSAGDRQGVMDGGKGSLQGHHHRLMTLLASEEANHLMSIFITSFAAQSSARKGKQCPLLFTSLVPSYGHQRKAVTGTCG